MTKTRKLYIIGIVSLFIAILSQVYLDSPLFDSLYSIEESNKALSRAVHITFLVTFPTFFIALATLVAAIILTIVKILTSKRKNSR